MNNNTNTFIELRQAEATNITGNGDYNCNLSNDIILNKGDQVSLKSVFIDTKTQGFINIPNDLNLTLQNTVYITDWNFDNTYKTSTVNEDGTLTCSGSGLDFIPMKLIISGDLPNAETITQAIYKASMPGSKPFTATYQYTDYYSNQIVYFHHSIPASRAGDEYVDEIDVLCVLGSFSLYTPNAHDLLYIYNMNEPTFTTNTGPIPNDIYLPYIFTNNIIIPAGSYTADNLTLFISKELSRNNSTNSLIQKTVKSPYLFSSDDFLEGRPSPDGAKNPDGTPYLLTADAIYISTGMEKVMKIANGGNYSIGSSQVALEVSTSNEIQWTYLHYPMYDDKDGTAISVRYIAQTLNDIAVPGTPIYTGNILPISKCGGIIWTGLTATDTITGQAVNFWEDILGFNLLTLCATWGQITAGNLYGGIEGVYNMFYPLGTVLQHGVNMTNGYYGLDSVIEKTPSTFYKITNPTTIDNPIISTVDTTNAIIADNNQDLLLNTYSHFLLETNLKMNNSYIGTQDTYHNYSGVITKYYSFGSYTYSGDGEGAFVYTHNGNNPIYLKNISIRILNSDKTIASGNIGEDNTIILEIIRNS
jgi:hypothetical protein